MNYFGLIVGASAFFIIGIFHPIVIKGEYYFGKRIWPAFLIGGVALVVLSLFIDNRVLASIIGVAGFSSLWGIHELFEQEERVLKGWFPKNPNRIYDRKDDKREKK